MAEGIISFNAVTAVTVGWIVGLLLTVFVGNFVVGQFRDRLRAYCGIKDEHRPKVPEGMEGVPAGLTGGIERLFFAAMVAVDAPAWPAAMMTWLLVKLATNWNFAGRNKDQPFVATRILGFVALLSGLLSMLLAFFGGIFIRWLSTRLSSGSILSGATHHQQAISVFEAAAKPAQLLAFDWNAGFAAFIGTFVGAYVAFKLAQRERAQEARQEKATHGNLALLTLFQMFNVQRQFQKEIIATAPEKRGRWLSMKVSFPQTSRRPGFEASRLAFILEGANKNLLPELLQEQHRYELAIEMINRRSHLMLEKIFPLMAEHGIQRGQNVELARSEAIVGPALAAEAESLTEAIVNNVNENIDSIVKLFEELRTQLVHLVPGEKFIRVEFDIAPKPIQEQTNSTAARA